METEIIKFSKWGLRLSDDRIDKWFSRSNIKWFNTRLPRLMYMSYNRTYFITAERMNENQQYMYTIRCADSETDQITSLDFQKYSTYKEAFVELENMLLAMEYAHDIQVNT